MPEENLMRMIQLAEEFFDAKNDPLQISVDEQTMARLREIHPNTISEIRNEQGPIAWVLVIPTSVEMMRKFIDKTIHEGDLLKETTDSPDYEAVYLCSALVLPEYRGKGLAKQLCTAAIHSIGEKHSIKYLFYWAFSSEGTNLARSVAKEFGLPLLSRVE